MTVRKGNQGGIGRCEAMAEVDWRGEERILYELPAGSKRFEFDD